MIFQDFERNTASITSFLKVECYFNCFFDLELWRIFDENAKLDAKSIQFNECFLVGGWLNFEFLKFSREIGSLSEFNPISRKR